MGIREQLYLATMSADVVEMAQKYNLGIELDEFCTAYNMDGEDFKHWDAVARRHLAVASRHIFHGPYSELFPAAIDPLALSLARHRFQQAYTLAEQYGIRHMVVHTGYVPILYFKEWFLERSILFWQEFIADKPDFFIFIENALEDEPYLLANLIQGINNEQIKACLDVGHAYCNSKLPMSEWLDVLCPVLGHTHLHNNDKSHDLHSPLNEGDIDIIALIHTINARAPHATFTIENRQCQTSLQWLEENHML